MKNITLLYCFLINISVLVQSQVVNYSTDYEYEGELNAFNLHADIPVFSGVFGGDYYGFSVGGQFSAEINSKFMLMGRLSHNLSPLLGKGSMEPRYIEATTEQIEEGRTQYTGVFRWNISDKFYMSQVSKKIGFENETSYYIRTETPIRKTYGIRLGFSQFANTSAFEEAIDLPITNFDNGTFSIYTSEQTPNGEHIGGWGLRLANPRTALRIGFSRQKMSKFEYTITNPEDFSFLEEKNAKRSGGFITRLYGDILVGLSREDLSGIPVIYQVKSDFDTVVESELRQFEVTSQLNYLPVGFSGGVERINWARNVSTAMFAELGIAPGYGSSIANNIYGKWGVRIGLSKWVP